MGAITERQVQALAACHAATFSASRVACAGGTLQSGVAPDRIGARQRKPSYSQPFCRAKRYASMRLATPSLPMHSDR